MAGREVGQVGVVGLDVGDDLGGCHLAGAELPADPVAGFQDAGVGAGDMRSAPHDSNELLLDGVGAGRCGQSEGGGTQCGRADQSGADQHTFEHWFSLLDGASMPRLYWELIRFKISLNLEYEGGLQPPHLNRVYFEEPK